MTAGTIRPFDLTEAQWRQIPVPEFIRPYLLVALRVSEAVLKLTGLGLIFIGTAAIIWGSWNLQYLQLSSLSLALVLESPALPYILIGGAILTIGLKILKNEPLTVDPLGNLAYIPLGIFQLYVRNVLNR